MFFSVKKQSRIGLLEYILMALFSLDRQTDRQVPTN